MSRINRRKNRKQLTAWIIAVGIALCAPSLLAEDAANKNEAVPIETVPSAQSILVQTSFEDVEVAEPPLPWPATDPIESQAPSKYEISWAFRESAQSETPSKATPLPIQENIPKEPQELDLGKLIKEDSRPIEQSLSSEPEEPKSVIPQAKVKLLTAKQLEMVAAEADTTHKLTRVIKHSKLALSVRPIEQEAALKIHSIAAWAFVTRGQMQQAKGESITALQDYTNALVHDSQSFTARQCRGVLFAKSGQINEAIIDFDKALTINPDSMSMRFNRASLLLSMGEVEKSHIDASYALELCKTRQTVSPRMLASLYELHGTASHLLGKSTQAHHSYTKALKLSDSKGHLYLKRGSLFASEGIYQQAIDDLLASIQDGKHAASGYRRLAWLLATCENQHYRNYDKAIESIVRARSLSPSIDSELEEITAAVYAAAGDYLKATEHQQKAILLTEDSKTRDSYRIRLSEYQEAVSQPASTTRQVRPASHSQKRRVSK